MTDDTVGMECTQLTFIFRTVHIFLAEISSSDNFVFQWMLCVNFLCFLSRPIRIFRR